jgi:spore photoproduct lyase
MTEATQKSAFVKHCPCSPGSVPCGYYNLNLHTGCPYDCSYCILQAYLPDKSRAVFFSNWADMEAELTACSSSRDALRIGSGELSDSLAYELVRPNAARVVELFRRLPQAVFEFKTKAVHVRPLLAIKEPPRNIVVSWSLNPPALVRGEESLTPALDRRLRALAAVQSRGYMIGIHFDPLILFPDWQEAYRELIRALAKIVRPGRVAWWSLGALRFPPELKGHIFRHRRSQLFWGELIQAADGKYRYFTPRRLELFAFIRREIRRQLSAEMPLYLCMEDAATWGEILPGMAAEEAFINRVLYDAALRRPGD